MTKTLLIIGLYGLGLSGVLIGSAMAIFGPYAVGTFFNVVLGLSKTHGPVTDLASVNVESEMRFYALMFVFYGSVLIHTAKDINIHYKRVPLLVSVFLLAGVARFIGYINVGTPHMLFVILMIIELGLPLLLLLLWALNSRQKT